MPERNQIFQWNTVVATFKTLIVKNQCSNTVNLQRKGNYKAGTCFCIISEKKLSNLSFNTPYMSYSSIVYPVKMEYGSKNNIFGLKMMLKTEKGSKRYILESLQTQTLFWSFDLHHITNYKFVM